MYLSLHDEDMDKKLDNNEMSMTELVFSVLYVEWINLFCIEKVLICLLFQQFFWIISNLLFLF